MTAKPQPIKVTVWRDAYDDKKTETVYGIGVNITEQGCLAIVDRDDSGETTTVYNQSDWSKFKSEPRPVAAT